MVKTFSSKVILFYNLICLLAAITLTSYWVYLFSLNEDLCTVDYKKYYRSEKDTFPVLSVCLKNFFSNEELRKEDPTLNYSSYLNFLKGQDFDPKMLLVHYPTITRNLTDYVEEDFVRYRNGTSHALHPEYQDDSSYGENLAIKKRKRIFVSKYSFFYYSYFYNCYDLTVPHDKNIHEFWFRFNSSIFPSSIRPIIHGFMTFLHYPNQLLIASSKNYQWPQQRTNLDSYSMTFHVLTVEVLKRRQKRERPCNENWEKHDDYIKKQHASDLGCRLPYMGYIEGFPLCSSKDQMTKKFFFQEDDYGVSPPCQEMKAISTKYQESTFNPENFSWARKGTFWIGIVFTKETFKEITQTR